jgi:hypothetical protein
MFDRAGDVIWVPCNQWKCETCQRTLAQQWAKRVRYGIALWPGDAYMWTLTLPGWIDHPALGFRLLPRRWQNLSQTVRRNCEEFHYAAFVELHPYRRNIPHFHIVSLVKAPKRLKDMAVHAGFGHQAKETLISGKQAAYYVTKYASKQGRGMPKGFRRVRTSQGWPKLPEPFIWPEVIYFKAREGLVDYFRRVAGLVYPHCTLRQLEVVWGEAARPANP